MITITMNLFRLVSPRMIQEHVAATETKESACRFERVGHDTDDHDFIWERRYATILQKC